MSAQTDWIYWDGSGPRGPVTLDALIALVRSGEVGPTTDIRRPSEAGWTRASDALPYLFAAPAADGVIAPSARATSWTDRKPHPWRRYLARMFDALIVGALLWTLIGMLFFMIAPDAAQAFFAVFSLPGGQFLDIILTQLVVIPANALAIGLTGLSLGKWIFGVKVLKDGAPIGFMPALRRELSVFVFGLGAGLPLVSLFTLIGAYNKLNHQRTTRWDKAQTIVVVHRKESAGATIGMWAAVGLFVIVRICLQILSKT